MEEKSLTTRKKSIKSFPGASQNPSAHRQPTRSRWRRRTCCAHDTCNYRSCAKCASYQTSWRASCGSTCFIFLLFSHQSVRHIFLKFCDRLHTILTSCKTLLDILKKNKQIQNMRVFLNYDIKIAVERFCTNNFFF